MFIAYKQANPTTLMRLSLAEFYMQVYSFELAEQQLVKQAQSEASMAVYLLTAQLYLLKEEFDKAEENIKRVQQDNYKHAQSWAILGHVRFQQPQRQDDAIQAFENAIAVAGEDNPNTLNEPLVYYRLGHLYLSKQKYDDARVMFLQAAKIWPCSSTWLGVGIAYLRMNDLVQAEQALNEANIHNNLNGEVWTLLALICARANRTDEAERCLLQVKRVKHTPTAALMQEMAQAFLEHEKAKQWNSIAVQL